MNTPMTMLRKPSIAMSLLAATLLAACASNAPNPALESARTEVNRTATNAEVLRRAPLELKLATDTIDQADKAWRNDGDDGEVKHLSYLAVKRAEIARNIARSRQVDDDIRDANSANDKLRLEARTREADQAKGLALSAQEEARRAQLQAASAQQDAVAAGRIAQAERAQSVAAQEAAAAERLRAAQATDAATTAQERVRVLEAQMKEIEGKQTERGLLVTLGDVLFAFNKSELTAQAGPRLDKLASFLKQFPQRKLLVEGYTDSVGGDSYNMQLSERRAAAIRDALVQRGVDASRIVTKGYGKAYPVAENGTVDGRALNRRVEVVIADENGNLKGRAA
jgi:outer membrane protein OmpA-like peptidoglycan-associated protein